MPLVRLDPLEIGRFHTESFEDRVPLAATELPEFFIQSLLAVEDRRFASHVGVDVLGILRAMGTPRGTVLRVFLVQGAIVGLVGSLVGSALGAGLARFFVNLARNADGSPTFPIHLGPETFVRAALVATIVGLLAAVAPARRAARLDPAEAIRND